MARMSSPRAAFLDLDHLGAEIRQDQVQTGPAMKWVKSITRTPSKATWRLRDAAGVAAVQSERS